MNAFLKSLSIRVLPVAFLMFSVAGLPAQEAKSDKKVDAVSPVGNWTWERKSDKKKIKSTLTIVKKDEKFEGSIKDTEHDLEIKNCTFDNGKLSFEVFPHPEATDKSIKFDGEVSANAMKGNMSYVLNGETKTTEWNPKRVDPMDAVVGKWLLEFVTPDGRELEFKIRIRKKGDSLQLAFIDDQDSKVKNVKFKDNVLSFDSDQVYEEQPISVEWDLKVNGKSIIGTLYYEFENTEDEGEIEVNGERIK